MENIHKPVVRAVRRFNRFYTNIIGILDQHMLESDFSLAEVRVLFEIERNKDATSKKLSGELKMDSGYLSRIIKKLEKLGLVYRSHSNEDNRSYHLNVTHEGKTTLSKLNIMSDKNISQMIADLPEYGKKRLVDCMQSIENILSDTSAIETVSIRSDLRPGDVGYLIQLHGWLYAEECGYNHIFEGYVCKTFYELYNKYDPQTDRFWLAEANGKMIGAIAIVGHTAQRAQLRYFIIHPEYRGIGLGKKLLDGALMYAKEKGYTEIFLETTDDQKTAVGMYLKAGFKLTEEYDNNVWGVKHTGQTYELRQ